MNIITSLQVSADCHHVFGGDANGFLFVWSLSRIYSEHLSRKDELQKNNNVYTFIAKWKICRSQILQIKIYDDYFLLATSQQLFKIPTKNLYQYIDEMDRTQSFNPNVIDLQELVQLNVVSKLVFFNLYNENQFQNSEFSISTILECGQNIFIGSLCGQIIIMDVDKEDILQIIDVNSVVNDVVKGMVPVKRNPITSLNLMNNNELVIGSQLGLLMILNLNTNSFSNVLKYPQKDQLLSPVVKTVYNKEDCVLVSLHEDHIAIWNMIVQDLVKRIPLQGASDLLLSKDGYIIVASETSKLLHIPINSSQTPFELQTSQSIVLGLQQFEGQNKIKELMFVRGDTPFIDVYQHTSYQFSLSCL